MLQPDSLWAQYIVNNNRTQLGFVDVDAELQLNLSEVCLNHNLQIHDQI